MILLVDIGNSRIKWAALTSRGLEEQQAADYANWDRSDLETRFLSSLEKPERVLVSNVGGDRIAGLIFEGMKVKWSLVPEFVGATATASGVRNAYANPEQLGVDRWLGLIAAHQSLQGLVCIVSVGTAMTVDGIDGSGQHLGGVIVPGPKLAVESLFRNTSDLAKRSQLGVVKTSLFADNTLGAIQQGIAHMLAALIEKSMEEMARRLGATPALLLTGGACEQVAPLLKSKHQVIPDLVLQGLAVLAKASINRLP